MKKLFYAYLFIFLNINITINRSTICITPAFAGYILLLMAFRELEGLRRPGVEGSGPFREIRLRITACKAR